MDRCVFISGATGYVGSRVARELILRGWHVRTLVRHGSEKKLPPCCDIVFGSALDPFTFAAAVEGFGSFIHLVGTPHPAPWKRKEFCAVDLVSLNASVTAASSARVRHFVYVSVAHPAPVMKEYLDVRIECEKRIRSSDLIATILRPWYVLGPGHRWPYALKPFYSLMKRIPATRDTARRLGLVTIDQISTAIVSAVENPPASTRILEVPDIRDNVVQTWTTSSSSELV